MLVKVCMQAPESITHPQPAPDVCLSADSNPMMDTWPASPGKCPDNQLTWAASRIRADRCESLSPVASHTALWFMPAQSTRPSASVWQLSNLAASLPPYLNKLSNCWTRSSVRRERLSHRAVWLCFKKSPPVVHTEFLAEDCIWSLKVDRRCLWLNIPDILPV